MITKTVNMVSVNYLQGNSIYLPYAAGALVAYAKSIPEINSNYIFNNIFFIREDTQVLAEKLRSSYLIGFSNYIWNFEYNKLLAQKCKKNNPECIILFGGHSINPDGSLLDECPFIDFLIHGEGEEIFTKLLLTLAKDGDFQSIPNISYRDEEIKKNTPLIPVSGTDYASPYLSGCFDKTLVEYPDIDFQAILETSRGCPYCCTYCDWGNLNSKVKKFPLEKIYADLEWFSSKKINFLMGADSNFGLFERDEKIVDKMVELNQISGFPKNFQTSYAKMSNERIFRMTKKLHKSGIDKGVTISYQSLSDFALENVKRDNISVEAFSDLLKKYNRDEIATYTELIIGLPGETFDSFINGIDIILNAGQHNSIYFHNCEWLPCSEMERDEYVEKFKIKTSLIPLNQPHREQIENDEVKEFSKIVTSTYSMSSNEWIEMNLYSVVIQCFHFYGLLQIFSLYLHNEKGIKYSD
ncbi:MAG: radical SAM protein, partial [Eubacteriales bacterium]